MRILTIATLTLAVAAAGQAQETRSRLSGSALIDHWVKAKWDELGIKPVRAADDAEFLRRACLDLAGVIPSLPEVEKFLSEKAPDRRARLVDRLLKDPRYADHWSDVWAGILIGFENDRREEYYWEKVKQDLQEMLEKNLRYDEFARRVITARGAVFRNPADEKAKGAPEESGIAVYVYKIKREAGNDLPKALAGKVTRTFMGVQIHCAQCHDHPFDKWTQEEFYGMASFFTEVDAQREALKPSTDKKKKDAKPEYYFLVEDKKRGKGGDLSIPNAKGGPIKAAFLETGQGADPGAARRETFAKYMTSRSNLQFARMAVNRAWAHLFGAGIVNPPDDFNGRNKPTHPELLDALARDFIDHQYDLQGLLRAIAGSEAYGLTSRSPSRERDRNAEKFLTMARIRALSPEQILDSVLEATDLGSGPLAGDPKSRGDRQGTVTRLSAQFRYAFADDEGGEVTDFSGTIPSALLMMNSQVIETATSSARGRLGSLLARYATPEEKVRAIFLSALSRPPTPGELSRWKAHAARAGGTAGYEDLLWTLLNTSEFLFNH